MLYFIHNEKVLQSHLLADKVLQWSRLDSMPDNALDVFIEDRVDTIISDLKVKLAGINIEVIDTKGTEKTEEENLDEIRETPAP